MADSLDSKQGYSDEFFDPYCDKCARTRERNVKPVGYCHDCYQCLCKDCLSVHNRSPSSSDHVIRTGEDMPKSQTDKPPRFEFCDIHNGHRKDQYCTEHRVLLCITCIPLYHKDCCVESLECATKRISSSEIDFLYDTVSDFRTQLLSAESRMKSNAEDLREQRAKLLKEIQEVFDKIKSIIDKEFQDIKSDLETKYQCLSSVLADSQKNINNVTVDLDSTLDDINALKGNIIDTSVFLKIQDILRSIDKCKKDVSTLNKTTSRKMLNFVPDKTMNDFFSPAFTMGTISLKETNADIAISVPEIAFPASPTKLSQATAAGYHSSGNSKPISETNAQKCLKYRIKLRDDRRSCSISGLVITPDGRRLLADCWNYSIKMFSRDMKIISSLSLPAAPWDIAVTGDKEAIVSVLAESKLFIIDVTEKHMSQQRTLELLFRVDGITTYKDKLVVTSISPSPASVKLIGLSGEVYWSTSTDQEGHKLFSKPLYVTCYDDGKSSTVIVTDVGNKTLTLLNSESGDVNSRRQVGRKTPNGVTTDNAGNVYVCYCGTKEVAVLPKDFSKEKIFLTQRDGISEYPQAITYDAEDHQLLVSCYRCNTVDCLRWL